jgi:hypothetical protein
VPFTKVNNDDYSALLDGIKGLADYVSQNLLDRRKSLVAIASGMPPSDDEGADQVVDALGEESTSRFITQAAREPGWITWLDSRKLLDSLFNETKLTVVDELLANWLVDNFALEHPGELIRLISRHQLNIGPSLWFLLGRKIGINTDFEIDKCEFARWVSLLLDTMPRFANPNVLTWLGERCAYLQDTNSLLMVFSKLLSHRLDVKEGFTWPGEEEEHPPTIRFDVELNCLTDDWDLNEMYVKSIKPFLDRLALSVLAISIREMEARHSNVIAWNKARRDWDSASYRRSAIEPHEQDQIHQDILIDAARDSLVAIGESNPNLSDGWLDTLSKSNSPLVRRLFIHALNERQDKPADDKLHFFLSRHGLHEIHAHHEIYRLIANLYPRLSEAERSELIALILVYEWADRDDERFADRTARSHFDWLQWLVDADPTCGLAIAARDKIIAEYPKFRPREHPDLLHWAGPVQEGSLSPYTVEQLLGKPASEWVQELLLFKGGEFLGPNRDGLRLTVREAGKKDLAWGLDLATELGKRSEWATDLWGGLLLAWEDWSANKDHCLSILQWLKTEELWEHNLHYITSVLHRLVRDGGKDCAAMILDEANRAARVLWARAELDEIVPESSEDWVQVAINRSCGILAQYWLASIELWRKGQDPKPEVLDDDYRSSLSEMMLARSKASGLALTILASQLAFMLYVDYDWTKKHLVECFDSDNDPKRFQQAWHGFLTWGRLNPQIVEEISPHFEKALTRLDYELASQRDRFIEYFTFLICFLVPDPREKWIPTFFRSATPDDRKQFAGQIERFLRGMNADQQREYWERWIKDYWEKRLLGIPQPLTPGEIAKMIEWTPNLGMVFQEAIELAVQMPFAEFTHSSLVRDLGKSNLVSRFPEPSVKLMVYLLKCKCPNYFWYGLDEIVKQLDRGKVSEALLQQFDELLASKGLS